MIMGLLAVMLVVGQEHELLLDQLEDGFLLCIFRVRRASFLHHHLNRKLFMWEMLQVSHFLSVIQVLGDN
jgi:hypothetical protein